MLGIRRLERVRVRLYQTQSHHIKDSTSIIFSLSLDLVHHLQVPSPGLLAPSVVVVVASESVPPSHASHKVSVSTIGTSRVYPDSPVVNTPIHTDIALVQLVPRRSCLMLVVLISGMGGKEVAMVDLEREVLGLIGDLVEVEEVWVEDRVRRR